MTQSPVTTTTLTSEEYAAVLERYDLPAPTTITPLSPYTVVLDNTLVLHLYDGPEAVLAKVALIERRLLAAGLPVPEIVALDTSRELVAADLLLERVQPGVAAGAIWPALKREEQEALSEALGRVIAGVHNLTWPGYGDFDPALPNAGLCGRWVEALVKRITAVSRALHDSRSLPVRLVDGALTALNDGDSLVETASPPVLSHCDLSWDNVLVQAAAGGWRISGLLGWSCAIATDEAWEFAELWLYRNRLYPDPDPFLSGYRSLRKPQADRRARRNLYRLLIHLEGALAAHQAADIYHYARHEAALLRLLQK